MKFTPVYFEDGGYIQIGQREHSVGNLKGEIVLRDDGAFLLKLSGHTAHEKKFSDSVVTIEISIPLGEEGVGSLAKQSAAAAQELILRMVITDNS